MFTAIPKYKITAESDRHNNPLTEIYTGEAQDRKYGFRISACERRDGKGAVGFMVAYGYTKIVKGETWIECWMILAAEREQLVR